MVSERIPLKWHDGLRREVRDAAKEAMVVCLVLGAIIAFFTILVAFGTAISSFSVASVVETLLGGVLAWFAVSLLVSGVTCGSSVLRVLVYLGKKPVDFVYSDLIFRDIFPEATANIRMSMDSLIEEALIRRSGSADPSLVDIGPSIRSGYGLGHSIERNSVNRVVDELLEINRDADAKAAHLDHSGSSVSDEDDDSIDVPVLEVPNRENWRYPCSMAVPREVWKESAEKRLAPLTGSIDIVRRFAPGDEWLLHACIGFQYCETTFGYRFDASEFNRKALQHFRMSLELDKSASSVGIEDQLVLLYKEALDAGSLGDLPLALELLSSVEASLIQLLGDEHEILAPVFSSKYNLLLKLNKKEDATRYREKAMRIWRRVNVDRFAPYIVE